MKQVLYALANLLRMYSHNHYPAQESVALQLEVLRKAAAHMPGPVLTRWATILELLAVDAS